MRTVIFFLSFLLLTHSAAAAAGIVLPPVEDRELYFEPGAEYEWTWSIHRASEMVTWLSGDLAEYAELDDPNQGGGERSVSFSLKLPNELEPGVHTVVLNAREEIAETSGVQARAAVGGGIKIISLYPDPWVQARLSVNNAPENTSTHADIEFLSFSEVDTTVYADITVFDMDGNVLIKTTSATTTIHSQERKTVSTPLDTTEFPPGPYQVEAVVKGSNEDINLETTFRIGTLEVYIEDYTNVLPTKSINRFELEVVSRWTSVIKDVHAEISFAGMTEMTPTININPIDGGKIHTFFDMRHIVNDTIAEGQIRIHFEDDLSMVYPITVNITNALAPRNENPGYVFEWNALTGAYLLLLILVIVNVVLLLRRKKK